MNGIMKRQKNQSRRWGFHRTTYQGSAKIGGKAGWSGDCSILRDLPDIFIKCSVWALYVLRFEQIGSGKAFLRQLGKCECGLGR